MKNERNLLKIVHDVIFNSHIINDRPAKTGYFRLIGGSGSVVIFEN